jgi:hypothetical protein
MLTPQQMLSLAKALFGEDPMWPTWVQLSKSKQDHWLRKAQLADQWLRFNPESPYVQS